MLLLLYYLSSKDVKKSFASPSFPYSHALELYKHRGRHVPYPSDLTLLWNQIWQSGWQTTGGKDGKRAVRLHSCTVELYA